MSHSAIQVRGIQNIVAAYLSNDAPNFAIFSGKELLTKYTGGDPADGESKLHGFLTVISQAGSGAAYQLRQYEENVTKITNATEWDYSFRFCVDESAGESAGTWYRHINDRLDRIEAVRSAAAPEDDDEAEPNSVMGGFLGMLNGILAKPEVQTMLMHKIAGWLAGTSFFKQPGAAMNGVPEPEVLTDDFVQATVDAMPADKKQRLHDAIGILVTKDPNVADNLYKIAQILATDPDKYSMFAKML